MTPARIRAAVVSERIAWIRRMIQSIRNLPAADFDEFVADPRNTAAAESYLRRGIEALLDLGRHILAKGFGAAVAEYKEIGSRLEDEGVLSGDQARLMRQIAGYRNRMVHFYHEVSQEELYSLCTRNLEDLEVLLEAITDWLRSHSEKVDQQI